MMMRFDDLAKLKTKKVVFENVIPALDPSTLEQLKELTSRRRVIEESINETSSITEAIAREMSGGLTSQCEQDLYKLKKYLPLLENLVFHFEKASNIREVGRWISRLKIQWSSAVVGSSAFSNLLGPKFYQVNNIRFELGMTLYLYAATLNERAFEIMPIDLVQSTTLFREAAGVYDYLSLEFLPCLQSASAGQRPPEATSSFVQVMSLICLAEAQAVTIRKAEEKSTSASLLAKLHHGVTQYLDEAASILYSGSEEVKDISPRFLEYVNCCKAVHELMTEKYFAENLKEGRTRGGQMGVAIGILHRALETIETRISVVVDETWRGAMTTEMEIVSEMVVKFEKENAFVWHEKITSGDELPVHHGSKIVTPIPYQPTRLEETLTFKT